MPSDLTPTRLRELIAAAIRAPWIRKGAGHADELWADRGMVAELSLYPFGSRVVAANAELITTLVNNAPALADDMEKARLLEWALDEGMVSSLGHNADGEPIETHYYTIDALRAAKEAANRQNP